MRPLDHLSGVAGLQTFCRIVQRHHHLVLQPSHPVRQVKVAVNQARQHRGPAQVDHFRAGRDGHTGGWADTRDALALDEHHLVRQHPARNRIKQLARADRGGRCGLRPEQGGSA